MKRFISALTIMALAATYSCQKPEYILPDAERQGFTSISAFFTSGQYEGSVLAKLEVTQEMLDEGMLVVPVPYYFPEESDDSGTPMMAMSKVRIRAELDNNCTIDPPLTILDLNEETKFVYTDQYGKSYDLVLYGKRKKSDKASVMGMTITGPACGSFDAFVDNENRKLFLYTTDDLSGCTATMEVSAHASVKTDLSVARDYNEPQKIVIASHSGREYEYVTEKAVPEKIRRGFNVESVRPLFNLDPKSRLGLTDYFADVNPSIAGIEGYLIVCEGDGSTPVYVNGQTGVRLGEITLGSAEPGSIASDDNGNLLICNHIDVDPYEGALNIYRTKSVKTAPELFCTVDGLGVSLPRGGKMEVCGNVDADAVITILYEGIDGITAANQFIQITVTDGKPSDISVKTLAEVSWGSLPVNGAGLVSANGKPDGGYFYASYGRVSLDYIDASLSIRYGTPSTNGNAWAWNTNQVASMCFNNVQYAAMLNLAHFPAWGGIPVLYLYNVNDPSALDGEFDAAPGLVLSTEDMPIETANAVNADDTMSCGDVLITQSADGFKIFIYYYDHYCGAIGGFVADCIKRD